MSSTGEFAVKESKKARDQQSALSITADKDEMIRLTTKNGVRTVEKIGVKTFYLENGVWVDSTFKETGGLTEIKLQFASNEYFDLITKEKELAKFFALGKSVIVVWQDKVYRVIE